MLQTISSPSLKMKRVADEIAELISSKSGTSDVFDRPLRILILSTPKTGNTWLTCLLSAMYRLPKLGLHYPFDYRQASCLGHRWIIFGHFMPDENLLSWIREIQPFVLTTIRHPGDVLISLYHHLHRFNVASVDQQKLLGMLQTPFERIAIEPPATHTFREELECSLAWKRTGLSRIVRYEDLRADTLSTLTSLANWIAPIEQDCIAQAIDKCDIDQLRVMNREHKAFFRSGLVGEWQATLSPSVVRALAAEPYQRQLEELGYALHSQSEQLPPARQTRVSRNPLRGLRTFGNGAATAPIIEDLYLSLDPEMNRAWPPMSDCGPSSFFQWIGGPCDLHGAGWYADVFLSRLAHHIYQTRPDLQQLFRDLSGPSRLGYADWFICNAGPEYSIDRRLVTPTRNALIAWGNRQFADRALTAGLGPPLTNYGMHLKRSRPDLDRAFPEPGGPDSVRYYEWLVRHAAHGLDRLGRYFGGAIGSPLFDWGNQKAGEDLERRPWWPKLTNFAMHLYRTMPEVREAFPDIQYKDRWDFLQWVVSPTNGLSILPQLSHPIRADLNRCAILRAATRVVLPRRPAR